MDNRIRSFEEKMAHRTATRRFESAFEALEQLPQDDRQLLLREVAERIVQQLRNAPSEEPKGPKVVGIAIERS